MKYLTDYRNPFDELFDGGFGTTSSIMRTDIRKKDGDYILDIDLPGMKKEDIKISLFNGNLTVTAAHTETEEEKNEKGSYLRTERFSGTATRTYYVGKAVKDTDIKASFNNGVLSLTVPSEEKKEKEEKKFIDIL